MPTGSSSSEQLLRLAGVFVAVGALMMLAKGVLLVTTGQDRSFVPWFGLLVSVGLTSAAVALWPSVAQWRWLAVLGAAGAVIGVAASLIAVGYLVTGTIPESPNAPELVGLSYAVNSAGVAVAVVALGVLIVGNRSLTGWWRWLPIGLIMAQLPIFIVAGAIGEGVGSEDLTDGLGLAITGAAWILFGYALSKKQQLDIPKPAHNANVSLGYPGRRRE